MNRPDGRIEKGQRLTTAISARAWNRAQDAADIVLGATPGTVGGQIVPIERASNIVLVRNTTNQNIAVGGVLGIAGKIDPAFGLTIAIDPTGGKLEDGSGDNPEQLAKNARAREFVRRPILMGITPMAGEDFVVAIEPIPGNTTGRCACGGVFAFRLLLVNSEHQYAAPKNNDTTRLVSANCGRLKILWLDNSDNGPNSPDGRWAVGMM